MRYALISDIHSNLVALDEVKSYLNDEKVDAYICCGDIVGYGPWPNECVEIIKDLQKNSLIFVVVGNHDWAALELEDLMKFNEDAREAIIWTKTELSEENKKYIKELPYLLDDEKFTVVHGSPRDPLDEYILGAAVFRHNLTYFKSNLCFVGHTHVPFYFYSDGAVRLGEKQIVGEVKILLEPAVRYMINIGSVGQPRDMDPRACLGIFDDEKKEVIIKRIRYDIKKTQEQMRKYNLPSFLIERLQWGM